MKPLILSCLSFTISFLSYSLLNAQSNTSREADRLAISTAYAEWVRAVEAKDIDLWASFLAPEAFFFPPDHPALSDREAILEYYRELFRDPVFKLRCGLEKVEVASAGDVAWAFGMCEATFTSPDGSEAKGTSKWVKVWNKQSNGEWKCAINTWNYNQPLRKTD